MNQVLIRVLAAGMLFITACNTNKEEQNQSNDTNFDEVSLEQVWATSQTELITPECVTYDPERNVFYVSNLNRENDTENDGYISIVNADGTVRDAHWVEGLDSPLGNDFHNGYLYVSDNGQIVQIDIENGSISKKISIGGASDLNGIDIAGDGTIYAADSDGNKIFRVSPEGEAELMLEDESLNTPNGVYFVPTGTSRKDDQLIIASSSGGSLLALDLKTRKLTTLVEEGLGRADGIIQLSEGHYLISSWTGEVNFITNDFQQTQTILNTSADSINAADIGYIPHDSLLVVPTFYHNRLVAYKVHY